MWFAVIRGIIISGFLVLLFFVLRTINRSKITNKRSLRFFVFVAWLISVAFISGLPFENLFVTFPTLDAACAYASRLEVETVLEGKDSAMVWFIENSTSKTMSSFQKVESGYKLGTLLSYSHPVAKIVSASPGSSVVNIYQTKGTGDYFIEIWDATFPESIKELSDNRNSIFQCAKSAPESLSMYYAYVYGINDDYVLTIDGNEYDYQYLSTGKRFPAY
jgi:WD40 repeat protein